MRSARLRLRLRLRGVGAVSLTSGDW